MSQCLFKIFRGRPQHYRDKVPLNTPWRLSSLLCTCSLTSLRVTRAFPLLFCPNNYITINNLPIMWPYLAWTPPGPYPLGAWSSRLWMTSLQFIVPPRDDPIFFWAWSAYWHQLSLLQYFRSTRSFPAPWSHWGWLYSSRAVLWKPPNTFYFVSNGL